MKARLAALFLCLAAALPAQAQLFNPDNLAASLAARIPAKGNATACLGAAFVEPVQRAARGTGLSPRLIAAVMQVETGGMGPAQRARAVSSAGAIGPMQLMPGTASLLHVNPWNPDENIDGGSRYLATLIGQFGGDMRAALMAYNAGPGAVMHGGGVPGYAAKVMANMQRCGEPSGGGLEAGMPTPTPALGQPSAALPSYNLTPSINWK